MSVSLIVIVKPRHSMTGRHRPTADAHMRTRPQLLLRPRTQGDEDDEPPAECWLSGPAHEGHTAFAASSAAPLPSARAACAASVAFAMASRAMPSRMIGRYERTASFTRLTVASSMERTIRARSTSRPAWCAYITANVSKAASVRSRSPSSRATHRDSTSASLPPSTPHVYSSHTLQSRSVRLGPHRTSRRRERPRATGIRCSCSCGRAREWPPACESSSEHHTRGREPVCASLRRAHASRATRLASASSAGLCTM
mmetsp:Transcript_21812/g.56121  ORF Transcript_21812/g.56121 Transcript_21812/m.56121 type:complete len:256 (+) Transcript_21812:216-983(+)